MFESITYSIQNTLNFNGRSSRKEYWVYYISCMILFTLFFLFFSILEIDVTDPRASILLEIVALVTYPTLYSIVIRRLHDIGLTGWIVIPFPIIHLTNLFSITPLYFVEISSFLCILIGVLPAKNELNKYGQPPII